MNDLQVIYFEKYRNAINWIFFLAVVEARHPWSKLSFILQSSQVAFQSTGIHSSTHVSLSNTDQGTAIPKVLATDISEPTTSREQCRQVSTSALQRRNHSEHICPQCTWVITVKIHLYQVKNMLQNKYIHFQSSSDYAVLFVGMLIDFIPLQKHKSSEKFTVVPSTVGEY